MITVNNLTKSYRYSRKNILVLDDISFSIQNGQSVALLGGNGAGKTTLLNLLAGIDIADSGFISSDVKVSWPVGIIGGFQPFLTGRQNVIFVAKIYSFMSSKPLHEVIDFVYDFAEIGNYFDKPFNTYSAGMRARVTFGISMAFDFDVYLLDEISGAGDQSFRQKCVKILEQKKKKSDFIMVNHNLFGLKPFCDKAFILKDKKILEYSNLDIAIKAHKDSLLLNVK